MARYRWRSISILIANGWQWLGGWHKMEKDLGHGFAQALFYQWQRWGEESSSVWRDGLFIRLFMYFIIGELRAFQLNYMPSIIFCLSVCSFGFRVSVNCSSWAWTYNLSASVSQTAGIRHALPCQLVKWRKKKKKNSMRFLKNTEKLI